MVQCYISNARLIDAPQVRMCTRVEPFVSLESCRAWCVKHTFSWTIREWNKQSPSLRDKILDSDDPII